MKQRCEFLSGSLLGCYVFVFGVFLPFYYLYFFMLKTSYVDYCLSLSGKHGVGRIDIVENRFIGMKSRGKELKNILYFTCHGYDIFIFAPN